MRKRGQKIEVNLGGKRDLSCRSLDKKAGASFTHRFPRVRSGCHVSSGLKVSQRTEFTSWIWQSEFT